MSCSVTIQYMEAITVICYGTLRQGFGNHHFLIGSKFIGTGKLVKLGTMYNTGYFPILSLAASSTHQIVVEVYEVSKTTLTKLDALEGYPGWYTRTQEEVALENGKVLVGWIYHQDEKVGWQPENIIESGDWAVHRNKK